MPGERTERYPQDRQGNLNRELDDLRAQEGMEGENTDEGIANIGSADTGSVQLVYSIPTHADRVFVDLVHGFNSVGSGLNTFSLYEVDLDGGGNITGSKRRSVPVNVASGATRSIGYEGMSFNKAIGVESDFEGMVGVGLYVDHDESSEPASVQTES